MSSPFQVFRRRSRLRREQDSKKADKCDSIEKSPGATPIPQEAVAGASSQKYQYDDKNLIIKDIAGLDTEYLTILIEHFLELDRKTDFTLEVKSHVAVLSFTKSKTDKGNESIVCT